MSTYTYRYVEIRREMIDGSVWKFSDLPDPNEHRGEIYRINEYNRPEGISHYYKSIQVSDASFGWNPVEKVEKKWVPVKWYSYLPKNRVLDNKDPNFNPKYVTAKDANGKEFYLQEHLYWCNNGGHIRDDYISSSSFERHVFAKRGLPNDVSDEVKEDIGSDYAYDQTWVKFTEWEYAFDNALKNFVAKVKERFNNATLDEINRKLDDIFKAVKDPNYKPKKKKSEDDEEYYEDTLEYLFEEDIWELFHIREEMERIEFIAEDFGDTFANNDVRVIYYLA